jgi:carboxypeptidase T
MAAYHVTIFGADRAAMADLVRVHRIYVFPQTLIESPQPYQGQDYPYAITAVADEDSIEWLHDAGYGIEQHENVNDTASEGLREVGQGNRFRDQIEALREAREEESAEPRSAPEASYLNVEEVEAALALATRPTNSDFTELVELPHRTWEGRTCHAIRIHRGPTARVGVYLLGGVHAREWGSPDILINLVRLLTDAYRTGVGITQGGQSFSAAEVRAIVDTLELVIFPQANPDGRHFSTTVEPMWRKNCRPAAPSDPQCRSDDDAKAFGVGPGVDINRNYDFVWDFPVKFNLRRSSVRTSTDPCDPTYNGPSAASEPETANVVWLLDRYPSVGYFIDVHSFGEDILYNWGDDDDQTTNPRMNFRDPAFDGRRGILDSETDPDKVDPNRDKYREYIPPADRGTLIALGTVIRDAIQTAHGRVYTVKQSVGLYATSGTSDDYAYSRSFVDTSKAKVLGYTIEWGPNPTQPSDIASVAESFHPPYARMVPIIEEVTAGLVAFCLAVAQGTFDAVPADAGTN